MIIKPFTLRLAGIGAAVWFLAESLLFWLCIQTFGLMPTLLALTLKGIGGLMLFVSSLKGLLRGVAVNPLSRGLSGLGDAGFSALGAFLIFLPGFAATLAGLALFSPSVRTGIMAWAKREKKASGRDQVITLDAADWQEIPSGGKTRAPARARRPRHRDVAP